jgi:phenylpropionate dioxygenase-like ring-hydroxylating dioxygenase large terminal subunit
MQSMLPGAPWLLAHKSMLKVNQPRKFSLYGNNYVLWKDAAGAVYGLPNACPHMGAMLSEGWCQVSADGVSQVVCPFHALEFDGAGCTVLPGSGKKTVSQLKPLELVIQGDFIWSYGGYEPKIPIPTILNEIAEQNEFMGHTADVSVETDLLTMLLNMHDYNHQNGTHRDLFRVLEVQFDRFVDNGLHSEAFYQMPTAAITLQEAIRNPAILALPKVLPAHLENFFPHFVILHGKSGIGTAEQCHVFVPEAEGRTRTYVLMFGKPKNPIFRILKANFLSLAQTVVEQDADILGKIYPDSPQKLKLNNEVGMDWVRRNFENFPIAEPTLSSK